jgi:hypothetical protein
MTKNKIIINSVLGSVIWESEKDTLKEAVVEKNNRDANLRAADLRGANLCDANLHGADLRGADLHGANLHGADLHGADLYGANLRGADLYGADLYAANLCDADLHGANLRGADLYVADLRGANLHDANLHDANLRGADLYGADLYGANLRQLPKDLINQSSRDIIFILQSLRKEVPYLKQSLIDGKVDGSTYNGDCACLVGTLGNADGGVDAVCSAIPFYQKGTQNPGENWFLSIHKGDTPETNQFAAHVMKLIEMVEEDKYYTISYDPTSEQLKEWEEKRKKIVEEVKKQVV